MTFRIVLLGPVELRIGHWSSSLGSAKGRLLLAALAWDAGRTLSTETLVNRLWDVPSVHASGNLQALVSKLRNGALKDGGAEGPTLSSQSGGYRIDAPVEAVDAHRHRQLVGRAKTLSDDGRFAAARSALDEAAELWRGEPLAGLTGLWADQIRESLTQRHLQLSRTRAAIALRTGDFDEAAAELWPLAARHPDNESLSEYLALALHGDGRSAEADEVIERTRVALRERLDTRPRPRLRRIRQAIAEETRIEELLTAVGLPPVRGGGNVAARSVAVSHVPDNLPPDINWIGREHEVRQIIEALPRQEDGTSHAVAIEGIDGMPGVGKTVLAIHLAHRLRENYPDGRLIVNLHGHDPTRRPLSTVQALTDLLRPFGYPVEAASRTEEDLVVAWRTTMLSRRALVVLDDAAGPEQVRPLLTGAPGSLVIVTSRHRLAAVTGARSLSLDVLSEAEAVALFQDRVRGRSPVDPKDIAEVVRVCGYLPLAVDIVAVRFLTRLSWTMEDLLRRLSQGADALREIRDGTREVRLAFDLSYQALAPEEQEVFRAVGLLSGTDFSAHAVAALTGIPLGRTENALESLFYAHLLTEPRPHRYATHDLLREFARTLANEEPYAASSAAGLDRLADALIQTADRADRLAHPHRARFPVATPYAFDSTGWLDESQPQRWLLTERVSLLAAWERAAAAGDHERSALFAHVLAGFLESQGLLATVEQRLTDAVTHWRLRDQPAAEARALLDLIPVTARGGALAEALAAATKALETARLLDDREAELEAHHQIAQIHAYLGQNRQGLPVLRRLVSLRETHSDARQQARCRNLLGAVLVDLGEHVEAMQCFRIAHAGFRSVRDVRGQYMSLSNIAELHAHFGDPDSSARVFREALSIFPEDGPRHEKVTLQMNLAGPLVELGDAVSALSLYQEAVELFRSMGHQRVMAVSLDGMGWAFQSLGRHEDAIRAHGEAAERAREIGAGAEWGRALRGLGAAECHAGRLADSEDHLLKSLEVVRGLRLATDEASTLRALADLRASEGRSAEAVELRREADAFASRLRSPSSEVQ